MLGCDQVIQNDYVFGIFLYIFLNSEFVVFEGQKEFFHQGSSFIDSESFVEVRIPIFGKLHSVSVLVLFWYFKYFFEIRGLLVLSVTCLINVQEIQVLKGNELVDFVLDEHGVFSFKTVDFILEISKQALLTWIPDSTQKLEQVSAEMNFTDELLWNWLYCLLFELWLVLSWLNLGHVLCCIKRYILIFWDWSFHVLKIELWEELVLRRSKALIKALVLDIWLLLHENVWWSWFESIFFEFIWLKSFMFFDTETFW